MTEQSIDKIISALEVYGAPILNLCTVIAAVGAVVCLIFFVVIFVIIIKGFRDMDKDWDDFKRR
jgi:NADH:ubiquinone oxidoreductase subunit 6 (subunit J)